MMGYMRGVRKYVITNHVMEPGRKLSYVERGDPVNPTLICVHGLTGCARDFDLIAENLSSYYHVICIDIAGRGESGYLTNSSNYDYPLYVADVAQLINILGINKTDWIGTSMGGIIAILLSILRPHLINKLVLNDIGPEVPLAGIRYLRDVLAPMHEPGVFSLQAVREIAAKRVKSGKMSKDFVDDFIDYNYKKVGEDLYSVNFDIRIMDNVKLLPDITVYLWWAWTLVYSKVLLLWGVHSIIMTGAVAEKMRMTHSPFTLYTCLSAGHVCDLSAGELIKAVREWLLGVSGNEDRIFK